MADETPESPSAPSSKRKNHNNLLTLPDVRRALSRCLRKLEASAKDPTAAKAMPVEHARALIYGYSRLADLIRNADAEEVLLRLRALEQRQAAMDSEQRVQ